MSYDPPNLEQVGVSATHAGAAGTFQNDVVLAAPGAGHRWRIWAWSSMAENATVAVTQCFLTEGAALATGIVGWGTGGAAGQRSANGDIPGGYALPENTALTLRWATNAAAGSIINVIVLYTEELVGT